MTDISKEINDAIAEQHGNVRDALNVALARIATLKDERQVWIDIAHENENADVDALRRELNALKANHAEAIEAINDEMGEWAGIETPYLPRREQALQDILDILDPQGDQK